MVSIKLIFVITIVLMSCRYSTDASKSIEKPLEYDKMMNKCFLSLTKNISFVKFEFSSVDRDNMSKLNCNDTVRKNIIEKLSYVDSSSIFFQKDDKKFVVVIGKAKGTSGRGFLYWDYTVIYIEPYKIYHFASLFKNVNTIYKDSAGKTNAIEAVDNLKPNNFNREAVLKDTFSIIVTTVENNEVFQRFKHFCSPN